MIGRQRLRIVRCWFTVIVLPLVAAGLSVGSMGRPWGALSLAGGTVVGIAGVAALATGIVLWVTAPGERSHQLAVLPAVTEQSAAITAFGRF